MNRNTGLFVSGGFLGLIFLLLSVAPAVWAERFYAGVGIGSFSSESYCGSLRTALSPKFRAVAGSSAPSRVVFSESGTVQQRQVLSLNGPPDKITETRVPNPKYNPLFERTREPYQQPFIIKRTVTSPYDPNTSLRVVAEVSTTGYAESSPEVSGSSCEERQSVGNFFLGYVINERFSIEAGRNSDQVFSGLHTYSSPEISARAEITALTQPRYEAALAANAIAPDFSPADPAHRTMRVTTIRNDYQVITEGESNSNWLAVAYRWRAPESRWALLVRAGLNFWKGRSRFRVTRTEVINASNKIYPALPDTIDSGWRTAGNEPSDEAKKFIDGVPDSASDDDRRTALCLRVTACGVDNYYSNPAVSTSRFNVASNSLRDSAGDDGIAVRGGLTEARDRNESGTAALLAVGIEFELSRDIGLRIEYASYGADAGFDVEGLQFTSVLRF
ncbi:MAG: hypothetical protein ISN29_06195 [Gammaproteobacteria bacterium AqS3]|nr:hypothetical protein [Gammaproteobacteria bacterium AqS3]